MREKDKGAREHGQMTKLARVSVPVDLPAVLTTAQVAEVLGVGPPHVRRLIRRGLQARRVGPSWRVDASELRRFAASWRPASNAGHRRAVHDVPAIVWETLAVLDELGVACAQELAIAVDRHEGNVRKYLVILRRRGFIEDGAGGQCYVTDAGARHLAASSCSASAA